MGPDIADWPIRVATSGQRPAGEVVPTRHGIALARYLDAQAERREVRIEPSPGVFSRLAKRLAVAIAFALRPRPVARRRAGYTLRV